MEGLCKERVCSECSYFGRFCGGCDNGNCLVLKCFEGTKYEGVTRPSELCLYKGVCPKHVQVGSLELPYHIEIPVHAVSKPVLPSFVPIVSLLDRRSWFWHHIRVEAIIVKLGEVLLNKELLIEVTRSGLHGFLGFDGNVILSTIMPDELLSSLSIVRFKELTRALRPDAVMTLDRPTYMDDPLLISWRETIDLLSSAARLHDLSFCSLGVIKGANERQIKFCIENLFQMGFRSFVFPVRELSYQGLLYPFLNIVLTSLESLNPDYDLIIYGKPYDENLLDVRIRFASFSWFIMAKRGTCYYGKSSKVRLFEQLDFCEGCSCKCSFCEERHRLSASNYFVRDVESLALHNLRWLLQKHGKMAKSPHGIRF